MSGQPSSNSFAADYVDVAERISIFRAKYPDGSLAPADPAQPFQLLTVGDQTFVVVVAAAYRSPDDPRPGIGMAQELIPGRTPYTRGSELQNAETSAWGRAIVATLAADTKKVASADEVRNRRAEQSEPTKERVTDTAWFDDFSQRLDRAGRPSEVRGLREEAHVVWAEGRLTQEDAKALKELMDAREQELTGNPQGALV